MDPTITLVGQFLTAATHHASAAMSKWTHGQVKLSLDELFESPIEEVSTALGMETDLLTAVAMLVENASGEACGQIILGFDELNGRKLAACLLRRDPPESGNLTAIEESALMETGNILSSAYLNELTRLTSMKLRPSAPHLMQDFAASILQQALMSQAMVSETAIVSRTKFEFNQQTVRWSVFFVPEPELLGALQDGICSAQ